MEIFRIFFSNHFIKNPQTTIALTFLIHIISAILRWFAGGLKGLFAKHLKGSLVKGATYFLKTEVKCTKKLCRFNKSVSDLETFIDYFCTSWKKFLNICFPAPKAWTSELRSQCSLPKSVLKC